MTRIDKIKALCEAATKGPWSIERTRTTLWVGRLRHNSHKVDDIVVSVEIEDLNKVALFVAEANASLIAQSRAIVPELLELVQEMAGALEFYVDGHHEDPAKATLAKYKAWNEGE